MSKWKCEICGSKFETFHAQGFNHKIYCPLCYFKKENQKLKKQLEEYKKENKTLSKDKLECLTKYTTMLTSQDKFIKYLEDEKDKLAKECSNIYEDSLGETRLVNEEIFNEINNILQKYKEILGGNNEKH